LSIYLNMKKLFQVFTFLLGLASIGTAKAQGLYFPSLKEQDFWDTLSANSLNWCTEEIPALYQLLEKEDSKAFILLKDGKIVLEKYIGTFTKDSLWYWASAGKSLTSFLVGKAKEDGFLKLTDTSSKYLGKGWTNCSSDKEGLITIKHQISMTTGLNDNVADNHCIQDTCLQYLSDAGTRWAYHNAPYTLLEKVISNATGTNINVYTQNAIKAKTGMTGFWMNIGDDNVYISKARSMARFGLLMQNNCVWNSDTLLHDFDYVQQMTQSSQAMNPAYGYLWWLNGKQSFMAPGSQIQFPGSFASAAPADLFAAIGKNGQLICVSKSKGLVMVRMGNQLDDREVPFLLCNKIWEALNKVMCGVNGIADQTFNPASILVYPNPASTILHIDYNEMQANSVIVTDCLGKEIMKTSTASPIDISGLSDGLYVLHFQFKNLVCSKKWIKVSH